MNKLPRGIIPPIVVPFDEREDLDEAKLREEIRYLVNSGVHGLSAGGSTGEGAILSYDELNRCLEIVMEEKPADVPLLAGVIRNSTREVLKGALDAKGAGADGLLITPPFYYGSTLEGNYAFYREIARQVSLPIVVYNVVPTNVITPEMFVKLLEIDEVVGIKQVDPIIHAETFALYDGKHQAQTYSACDFLLYSTYVSGSDGSISALATIAPQLCVTQWNAFLEDDQKTASEIQKKLLPVVRCYQKRPFPGRVKALLNLQGREVGRGRMPNVMPDEKELAEMRSALTYAGLI